MKLKNQAKKTAIVYDEGDMYGTWAKPITKSMRTLIKQVDVVSVRGLGVFARSISKLQSRIIYTPHHADIARFDREPYLLSKRANKLVMIGNRVRPKVLSRIRRIPGSKDREKFVKLMGQVFPDEFALYGHGWDGFSGNRGSLNFQKQLDVYRESWISVAYEHYPEIPYYFSNRLPLALMAGAIYVCHYHKGYENIFNNCDFIFFFGANEEAIDVIRYIQSLTTDDILARSARAREFALKHYHPHVSWAGFLKNVTNVLSSADY